SARTSPEPRSPTATSPSPTPTSSTPGRTGSRACNPPGSRGREIFGGARRTAGAIIEDMDTDAAVLAAQAAAVIRAATCEEEYAPAWPLLYQAAEDGPAALTAG